MIKCIKEGNSTILPLLVTWLHSNRDSNSAIVPPPLLVEVIWKRPIYEEWVWFYLKEGRAFLSKVSTLTPKQQIPDRTKSLKYGNNPKFDPLNKFEHFIRSGLSAMLHFDATNGLHHGKVCWPMCIWTGALKEHFSVCFGKYYCDKLLKFLEHDTLVIFFTAINIKIVSGEDLEETLKKLRIDPKFKFLRKSKVKFSC